jgi:CsoR family transcriptional regulator, copper-sensing transcriptional repressor
MGGKASDKAGAVDDRQHGAGAHRGQGHSHSPHQQTKAVLNRLSRTEGHLRAVRRMVEEGRDCADILIQLAAIRSAVDRVARVVLEDHVESCLRQAATNGTPDDEWESLKTALDRFIS